MEGLTTQMEDMNMGIMNNEDINNSSSEDDCLKLSRYLYRKDEIELMIIQCVLNNAKTHISTSTSSGGGLDNMSDIQNEIISIENDSTLSNENDSITQFDKEETDLLFWISEYVESYSFQEVWQFIWKIYFDFYAFHYSELFYMIVELKKEVMYLENVDMDLYYQESHINHMIKVVLSIIKTMQVNTHDPKVFYIRMKLQAYAKESSHEDFTYKHKIYLGRKAEVIRPYSKPIQNMLLSIRNHEIDDIIYYLHILSCDDLDIISQLTNHALELENNALCIPLEDIKKYCLDFDFTHITIHYIVMVLHYIVSMISKSSEDITEFTRKKPSESHIKHILQYRNSVLPVQDIIPYIWTTFPIHQHCYVFQLLSGYYSISLRQEYMHHLEWHCRHTLIWKYRWRMYKYTIQQDQRCVEFHNIEHLHQYYERYGYEPCRSSDMIIKHMMRELNRKEIDDVHHLEDWVGIYLDAPFDLKQKCIYAY